VIKNGGLKVENMDWRQKKKRKKKRKKKKKKRERKKAHG